MTLSLYIIVSLVCFAFFVHLDLEHDAGAAMIMGLLWPVILPVIMFDFVRKFIRWWWDPYGDAGTEHDEGGDF